jgi:hypothetical protein
MAPLLIATYVFSRFCSRSFHIRTRQVPLDQLPLVPRELTPENSRISTLPQARNAQSSSSTSELMTYPTPTSPDLTKLRTTDRVLITTRKSLEELKGEVMEDVVYTPEQHVEERYSTSYLNPVFSRPLARPWVPLSHARFFSIGRKKGDLVIKQGEGNV